MSRRPILSVLAAATLLAGSVAGASSASALASGARTLPVTVTATGGPVIPTTDPTATGLVGLTGTVVPDATGTYYPLAMAKRLLDTRSNGGAPLAGGSTTAVTVTGTSGIPATGVSAVVLNVTAVNTTVDGGYFTVYPGGGVPRPTASTVNFPKAWTGANMATVPVGSDGRVRLYNYGGRAHAVVDVLGWYAQDDTVRAAHGMGAQFLSTGSGDPERIYDSRLDESASFQPFLGGEYVEFQDTWASESAATAVQAYAMTITAVGATSEGVLTAWAGGGAAKPTASTVNYQKGVIAPNMAVVPAGHYGPTDTGFRVLNTGSGTVHVVVDVTGYYVTDDSPGMRFRPLSAPKRILDTRKATGLSGAFGARAQRDAPTGSVASADSVYVVGNTTGILPTVRTYLTVWSGENARPTSSNLNVNPGLVRAVSTYAPLAHDATSGAPTYRLYNDAGSMHVAFDAAGTLDLYPGQALLGSGAPVAGGPDAPTSDRTPARRTLTDVGTFAAAPERTTSRRG